MSAEYSSVWLWEHYQCDIEAWKLTDQHNGFQCKRCGMWVTYVTKHAANVHGDDVIIKPGRNPEMYDHEGRITPWRQAWILRVGDQIRACYLDRDMAELAMDKEARSEDSNEPIVLENAPLVLQSATTTARSMA